MEAIVSEMGKKATFLKATNSLAAMVESGWDCGDAAGRDAIFNACKRCFSLLRSRYSAVGFWRAGKALAEACVAAMHTDPKRLATAKEWLSLAVIEVTNGDAASG
eukprot:CAMPEP_0173391790 /NCGR_PEP_ID=MMETSP1356-20130122/18590_1 /TAXON_ID=77927 ORGANISM="Hemiselmis virescens, Strain PCC157" /NCGR_SAMPLE_ID=MMETSP1356 /ASSEMBLY_ACC=CAM_ASM_000847 /LENGTH=104 /DNA_ID=CAMNT_0014349479 /DNA_START=57 /DNA_END=368 /DNA_ORIENTATION=+